MMKLTKLTISNDPGLYKRGEKQAISMQLLIRISITMATKKATMKKKKKTTTPGAAARKVLNLAEKVEVLKELEKGRSVRSIAEDIGVGKTQISDTNKKQKQIEESWENGANGSKKQLKKRK